MGRNRSRSSLLTAVVLAMTAVAVSGASLGVSDAIAEGVRGAPKGPGQLPQARSGGAGTVRVASTPGLITALRSAKGGEVIRLAPGVYEGFSLKGISFNTGVTITSADPAKQAVFTDFRISDVAGLTFENLVFATQSSVETKGRSHWAFTIIRGRNIHFDRVHVHGSRDGDPANDVQGIHIRHGSDISVTNSEFQQLERGMAIGNVEHVKVQGNHVHDVRSDGFDFAGVSFVEVRGNVFSSFRPSEKDHPDAIQFWTAGTKKSSHDIVVSENVILRGDGHYTQGIFLRDQTKKMPFERVTISDNLLVNTGYNAIRVNGVKGLTLTNNTLVSAVGENKTWLRISNGDGVVATGNRGSHIDFDKDVTGLVAAGNTITRPTSDVDAAVRNWIRTHPESAAHVSWRKLRARRENLRSAGPQRISMSTTPD